MPLSRRSFSFYSRKRDGDNKPAPAAATARAVELPGKQPLSPEKRRNNTNSSYPGDRDDLVYRTPKLSRKSSVSVNLIDELRKNSLYREQKQRLEHRKTRSSEFLFDTPWNSRKVVHFHFPGAGESVAKTLGEHHKRKSVSLSELSPKPWLNPEGSLDFGSASKVQPTNTTSRRELEEKDLPPPRQLNSRTSANRKHGKIRSVWYDVGDEYEIPVSATLRRGFSLDNLLDLGGASRWKQGKPTVTKQMISTPLCPRKIEGNWSDMQKVLENGEGVVALQIERRTSEADVAVEYFTQIAEEKMEAEEENKEEEKNDVETKSLEAEECTSTESGVEEEVEEDLKDLKETDEALQEHCLETSLEEEEEEEEEATVLETVPKVAEEGFGTTAVDFCTCNEPTVETAAAVVEEVHFKKHSTLDRIILRKHGTLEGKGRTKRPEKMDISTPTMSRRAEVADVAALDGEGITNLLRVKSKSTNLPCYAPGGV
ncbi:hypothetical protein NQ315_000227 [Exocentrus adspersus]|uniref:Uncharacterized protein n=1 Tax=Exocentrus adspersus TaxID=1586481 RepID=A0AAV8VQQ5_9CUCU|nr:hypothetical protein NQ315_000227 [Exocentrus adspersus]